MSDDHPHDEMNRLIRLTLRGRRDAVVAVLRRLGLGPADDEQADAADDDGRGEQ